MAKRDVQCCSRRWPHTLWDTMVQALGGNSGGGAEMWAVWYFKEYITLLCQVYDMAPPIFFLTLYRTLSRYWHNSGHLKLTLLFAGTLPIMSPHNKRVLCLILPPWSILCGVILSLSTSFLLWCFFWWFINIGSIENKPPKKAMNVNFSDRLSTMDLDFLRP